MNKTCNVCNVTKPLSEFYARARMKDGYSHQCRKCEIARQRIYADRPEVREKRNAQARLRQRPAEQTFRDRLWTWYRLRVEDYWTLLERQEGRCAICLADEPGGQGRWHVDHDHACCPGKRACGKCIRGLLCARCNPMIAMAKDDLSVLHSAVEYLLLAGSNRP